MAPFRITGKLGEIDEWYHSRVAVEKRRASFDVLESLVLHSVGDTIRKPVPTDDTRILS
jgi:hypothetical protein